MEKEKVLVVFGGKSAEHDISIITGLQVLKNINREKYDVFPLYVSRDGAMLFGKKLENYETYVNFNKKSFKQVAFKPGEKNIYIQSAFALRKSFEVSCAVLCLHGLNGEDGTVQGVFELSTIPYTSASVMSSAICMDKIIMKDVLVANKIETPLYHSFSKTDYYLETERILEETETALSLYENSCFVKPANLGSSIGISKCETKEQLEEAIEIAASYDERIIVEKAIENAVEVNCAVLGNSDYQEVSALEYPKSWSSFLSFDEKYIARNNAQTNSKKEPKKLSQSVEQQIQEISKKAFKVFDCSGVVRIDFLVDKKQNKIYLNELNSIPGSLAFYLFKDQGYTFEKLITRLIELAKTKMETKLSNKYSYSSNALANFGKGSKMNKYTK